MLNRQIWLKLVKLSDRPFGRLGSLFESARSFAALPISAPRRYIHPFQPSQSFSLVSIVSLVSVVILVSIVSLTTLVSLVCLVILVGLFRLISALKW